MLFKLITSIALFALVALAVVQAMGDDPIAPLIAVLGLMVGYHRNLTMPDGSIPFARVVTSKGETPKVRYTIWGLPLAPAIRVRVSDRARNRAVNAPLRASLIECLPAGLRWFIRKVSA